MPEFVICLPFLVATAIMVRVVWKQRRKPAPPAIRTDKPNSPLRPDARPQFPNARLILEAARRGNR